MYLGIDLGTSGVKALLIDGAARRSSAQASGAARGVAAASRLVRAGPGRLDRRHRDGARRAEGDASGRSSRRCAASACPATCMARRCSTPTTRCCGPASSGTTRAATPKRPSSTPIRASARSPATSSCPASPRRRSPGCKNNEPEIFAKVAKVLLPKDYLRLWLTGEHMSEMSDAAGTLWLDVGRARWSDELLAATDLNREAHAARWSKAPSPPATLKRRAGRALGHGRQGRGRRRRRRQCRLGLRHGHGPARRRPSSRSARRACCSPPTAPICPIRKARCTPSATPCRTPGTRWASSCRRPTRSTGCRGITGKNAGELTAELGDRLQGAGRRHLPALSLAASARRTTTPASAAPSPASATQSDRATLTQAVLEGVAFAFRDCLEALARRRHRADRASRRSAAARARAIG